MQVKRHQSPAIRRHRTSSDRKGSVTVEFAFMMPILVLVCFGMYELNKLMHIRKDMSMAVREGARVATLDRREFTFAESTTNAKIAGDIRKMLMLNGLPENEVDIWITEPGDLTTNFDLDDPDNNMRYFQVHIEYEAAHLLTFPLPTSGAFTISATVVFRNGTSTMVN
jgi:TadE-like protein